MNEITANYDQPWKEAIGEYFEQFLRFFFFLMWIRDVQKNNIPARN